MKTVENVFVVPTYRLRDLGATIEAYDEHFWSNGHSVKMMVFDDSSLANHEKYFGRLNSAGITVWRYASCSVSSKGGAWRTVKQKLGASTTERRTTAWLRWNWPGESWTGIVGRPVL
jgi:hypothetical protein